KITVSIFLSKIIKLLSDSIDSLKIGGLAKSRCSFPRLSAVVSWVLRSLEKLLLVFPNTAATFERNSYLS
ncbi:MAG TPA: hypothetical protein V6D30_13710, partial [Leptolyngbyaceae cyanobacterium]